MSIEKAHIMTGNHDEEQTHKIAFELGWSLKKGPMMPCKACLFWKVRQLAINKHVENSKKTTRACKRIFLDLVMIEAPQGSGITVTGTLLWISTEGTRSWSFIVPRVTSWNQYAKKLVSG